METQTIVIAVAVVIIIALLVLVYQNRKDVLQKAALEAVARAQQAWGSNAGKLKFAEVYAYLKTKYPVVTFFISQTQMANLIERALEELKKLIETKAKKNEELGIKNDALTKSILEQIETNKENG